jgi:cytochrome c-type biogenesis protein CcmH/NrfG
VPGSRRQRRLLSGLAASALWLGLLGAPALADGQLSIGSSPSGAAVFVEGQYAGVTPVLLDAPAGTYRVRVQRNGHQPREFAARVVDGLTTRRSVSLTTAAPARGELRVFTRPAGSALYLNGSPIGSAPAYVAGLKPGRYRLAAVHQGHKTAVRTIEIQPGLTSSVSMNLSLVPPPPVAKVPPAPARRAEPRRAAPAARPAAPRPQEARPQAARPQATAPSRPAKPAARPARPMAPQAPAVVAEAPVTVPDTAAPAPIAPTPPVVAAAPFVWPDARGLIFWSLMGGLLVWLGRRALARSRQAAATRPVWYPSRPAHWVQPWPYAEPPDAASTSALSALALGGWTDAAEALYATLGRQNGTAWHYYHLGLALQHAGRLPEAEAAYRTAIQLAPDWAPPHFNLAIALTEAYQVPQAVIAYRKLLEAHPADVDALFNLGHLYHRLRMGPQAIAQWQAARKLAPRDAAIKVNLRAIKRSGRVAARQQRQRAQQLRRAG